MAVSCQWRPHEYISLCKTPTLPSSTISTSAFSQRKSAHSLSIDFLRDACKYLRHLPKASLAIAELTWLSDAYGPTNIAISSLFASPLHHQLPNHYISTKLDRLSPHRLSTATAPSAPPSNFPSSLQLRDSVLPVGLQWCYDCPHFPPTLHCIDCIYVGHSSKSLFIGKQKCVETGDCKNFQHYPKIQLTFGAPSASLGVFTFLAFALFKLLVS